MTSLAAGPGCHVKPPYVAWQLTDDVKGPWGVRSATGVNVLGRLLNPPRPGVFYAAEVDAIGIAAAANERIAA